MWFTNRDYAVITFQIGKVCWQRALNRAGFAGGYLLSVTRRYPGWLRAASFRFRRIDGRRTQRKRPDMSEARLRR